MLLLLIAGCSAKNQRILMLLIRHVQQSNLRLIALEADTHYTTDEDFAMKSNWVFFKTGGEVIYQNVINVKIKHFFYLTFGYEVCNGMNLNFGV